MLMAKSVSGYYKTKKKKKKSGMDHQGKAFIFLGFPKSHPKSGVYLWCPGALERFNCALNPAAHAAPGARGQVVLVLDRERQAVPRLRVVLRTKSR